MIPAARPAMGRLSLEAISRYGRHGKVSPVKVLSAAEAAGNLLSRGEEASFEADEALDVTFELAPDTADSTVSATLVRAVDAFRHFREEEHPLANLSPEAIAYHARVTGETIRILMRGASRVM
jgi:hypothetical protein